MAKIPQWERQREKQRLKMQDPEYQELSRQKKMKTLEKAREKQRAKLASPEYREQQRLKARERAQRQIDRAKEKAAIPKPATPKKPTRGLKGRAPTAEERRFIKAVGQMPCIACEIHGVNSPVTSPHHINGRTAPDAHMFILPLCKWHHQYAAPIEVRAIYPWLVPVHADGSVGGKAQFNALNDTEQRLHSMVTSKTTFLTV